jgi:hypothetical protein
MARSLAVRSRLVLGSADGLPNVAVGQAFDADIRSWVKARNGSPHPFIWTNTAQQIPESVGDL